MEERKITVGFVKRPHGLKGELVFSTDLHDLAPIMSIGKFTLEGERDTREVTVENVRGSTKRYLIKFFGYDSVEDVEGLGGGKLVTQRTLIPQLPEGEFYHFDIVGMRVCVEDGNELGRISEILETGANDVYTVRADAGAEYLIPATKEVVKRIDIERREMVVAPLEGMIEDL